jgi:hypothetical protein
MSLKMIAPRQLIRYLNSPAAVPVIERTGLEAIAARGP